MKWTVIWKPTAENRLANLWTTSPDRTAVKAAADEIDQTLERDPLTSGESRSKGRRILFVPPLVAYSRFASRIGKSKSC